MKRLDEAAADIVTLEDIIIDESCEHHFVSFFDDLRDHPGIRRECPLSGPLKKGGRRDACISV